MTWFSYNNEKDGRQAQCISRISTPSKIAFSLTDDSSVQGTFSMRVLPGKKQGRKKKIISTKDRYTIILFLFIHISFALAAGRVDASGSNIAVSICGEISKIEIVPVWNAW